MTLQYVKDIEDKTKDCGNCYYFSTNGMLAPSGWCSKHPEFNSDICISYNCFPAYATVCEDLDLTEKWMKHE